MQKFFCTLQKTAKFFAQKTGGTGGERRFGNPCPLCAKQMIWPPGISAKRSVGPVLFEKIWQLAQKFPQKVPEKNKLSQSGMNFAIINIRVASLRRYAVKTARGNKGMVRFTDGEVI